VYRNSFNSSFHLTSVFHGLSFSFVSYGSDLLVKVWFVFIVLTWETTPSQQGSPVYSMYFRRQSTQRHPSVWKVTHETRYLVLFASTSVTRQCTGTLSTHQFSLSRGFHGLSFSSVVYGFNFSVKVWFVFIVLPLEVPRLLQCFCSTILVVVTYLFFCVYHFPR
jgi:hypothetical protein